MRAVKKSALRPNQVQNTKKEYATNHACLQEESNLLLLVPYSSAADKRGDHHGPRRLFLLVSAPNESG